MNASAAMKAPPALPLAGTFMPEQGGFFAGIVQIDGAQYGVVVSPKAQGQFHGAWGGRGKEIPAKRFADGLSNTRAMAEAGSPIAKKALALDINGQQDWYVPARDELELIYRNLKPTAEKNYCGFRDGENPSSVPPGFLYEESSPTQTPVEAFQDDGAEAMDEAWYWSSTQYSADDAFIQFFNDGGQYYGTKSAEARVRAVRRFLID